MIISKTQASQFIGAATPYTANGSAAKTATMEQPACTDSVEISDQAKELATTAGEGRLPLEAYSLPGWYGELLPDYCFVDTELGTPYKQSKQALYDSLSRSEKRDLSEYSQTLHGYFQKELESRGINSAAEYYENMVKNQEINQEVEQAVKQSLARNPRAMQLMSYFNLSL